MKLTEEDIRPQNLMAGQKIAALTDVGRILSRCGEFVEVSCPACGVDHHALRYSKNGLRYVECQACQTLYITPRPTPELRLLECPHLSRF
jgi:ribosomal protein S27E